MDSTEIKERTVAGGWKVMNCSKMLTRLCSIVPISFTNTHAPERMIFLALAIALCINNQHSV